MHPFTDGPGGVGPVLNSIQSTSPFTTLHLVFGVQLQRQPRPLIAALDAVVLLLVIAEVVRKLPPASQR
jgi:hypothetical protein